MPNRTVRRHVQGVDLILPWSHKLPDYARHSPTYGQNLVELAVGLDSSRNGRPFRVVDVGANVGDSALQVIAQTSATVLCVEGDPYWADYLRRNVGHSDRVTIAEFFLQDERLPWSGATPVRVDGTTHFVADPTSTVASISVAALREQFRDFDDVRLIKTDTDGLDVALVPSLITTWSDCDPVVFFEFDPRLTRDAGFADPDQVWDELTELGYTRAALWDNGGRPLGQLDISAARRHSPVLAQSSRTLGYHFWDVAVRRESDTVAAETFDRLMPQEFGGS